MREEQEQSRVEQEQSRVEQEQSRVEQEQSPLIHDFLIEEYKHASIYALNILRDRTQIISLYAVILGAFSYAIVQLLINKPAGFDLTIAILLLFYGLINGWNFGHFVTLEVAYYGCISRMDDIRRYYEQRLGPKVPSTLTKIFSLAADTSKIISPTKQHLPTNRTICLWYTILELASFIAAGYFFDHFWRSYWFLTITSVVVCVGLGIFQSYYYWKRVIKQPQSTPVGPALTQAGAEQATRPSRV